MFKLIEWTNFQDKKEILSKFDPEKSLWITSDIKSKIFILGQLRQRGLSLSEKCVVRASDFWRSLLLKTNLQKQVVSESLLVFIYEEWAKSQKQDWKKTRETGRIVCQFLDASIHLIKHPNRDSLMQEWFQIKKQKWKWCYELAIHFWHHLENKNMIASSWADAYLLDQVKMDSFHFEEIIFDLHFDISPLEAGLITEIASKTKSKIKILAPLCFKNNKWEIADAVYACFHEKKPKEEPHEEKPIIESISIRRFASQLAEIKDIVSEVRKALKRNVSPSRIAIISPQVENYWPGLSSYFRIENIPANKRETVPLSSFPMIQFWLAQMWTHLSVVKYENLECMARHQNTETHFGKFQSRFYYATQVKQIPSDLIDQKQLKNKNETVDYFKFKEWALQFYSKKDDSPPVTQAVEECVHELSQSAKALARESIRWKNWLSFLETSFRSKEVTKKNENPNGVHCLSFNAIGWLDADFVYIAGLNEQNMAPQHSSPIPLADALSIQKDLGFFLQSTPHDKLEKIISQFIDRNQKQIILSFASSDFHGNHFNPSSLWLKKALSYKKPHQEMDTPGTTLWDEKQKRKKVSEILVDQKFQNSNKSLIEKSIEEDMGRSKLPSFQPNSLKKLSASSLADYVRCPFIFASKNLFGLWDEPIQDVNMSFLDRGRLIHKIFEKLKKEKESDISESDILYLIESIKEDKEFESQLRFLHPVSWEIEKKSILKIAQLFYLHEKNKKEILKGYETIGCEVEFCGAWSFEKKSLQAIGDIPFKGKIDRLDASQDSYLLIDYKGSLATGSIANKWASEGNFGLAFYMQAIEKGLTSLPPHDVKVALYMSYKDFTYQGFALKEEPFIHWIGKRKKSLLSPEQKISIQEESNHKINDFILHIQAGQFPPEPQKKSICENCRWRNICRATHLN